MIKERISADDVIAFLRDHKVLLASQLAEHFDCSKGTIWRKLEGTGYLTSFNLNGSVLTLPDIPEWDEQGLWEFRGARFSRWGNLFETIVHLVEKSNAGFRAQELKQHLHDNIHHHLSLCVEKGLLYREGARKSAVYYSMNSRKRRVQMKRRGSELRTRIGRPPGLTKGKIIDVLALAIKHRATSVEELMPLVRSKGMKVNERGVRWIIQEYEIKKKGFRSGS